MALQVFRGFVFSLVVDTWNVEFGITGETFGPLLSLISEGRNRSEPNWEEDTKDSKTRRGIISSC